MSKLSEASLHALKVALHIMASIIVMGALAYIKQKPELLAYSPIVNVILAWIVKFFTLETPPV